MPDTHQHQDGAPAQEEAGGHRLLCEIGRGGMGVVYEAVHGTLRRRAAVKLLSPALAADTRYRRRFLAEARAAGRVRHPGLVQIYDCGERADGTPYLAMEFLEGETLRQRLRRGRLPVAAVLQIGVQVAEALATLHAHGVLHRDLKPENLMLVPDKDAPGGERVKLLDFGIAKVLDEQSFQTTAGTVVGSTAYMAPERCEGQATTGRADVYALGVVLYEILSGAPPFTGGPLLVMRRHVYDAPPPLVAPARLAALVHRMLAKEPEARPDAAEAGALLRAASAEPGAVPDPAAVAATEPQEAVPPPRSPRRRRLAAAGVLLLAVLLSLGAWALLRSRPPRFAALPSGTTAGLTALWGRAADDLWIVGKEGTVLRWDGARLSSAPVPTRQHLYGVWGVAEEIWAVGERGTVLRHRGGVWEVVPSGTEGRLDAVWGASRETLFVVGQGGTILRWDGARFSPVESGTALHLRGLWGSAADDVFAVGGNDNAGVIVHFDGQRFAAEAAPARLKAVFGRGPREVFTVGGTLDNSGVILRFDGKSWHREALPSGSRVEFRWLQGVATAPSGPLWIVGDGGVILRYDRGRFAVARGAATAVYFRAIFSAAPDHAFAVGTDGAVFRLVEP